MAARRHHRIPRPGPTPGMRSFGARPSAGAGGVGLSRERRSRSSSIEKKKSEGDEGPETQEDVEHGRARFDDVLPVDGEEESGDGAPDQRAEQVARDEDDEDYRDGAHDRAHESPPERCRSEEPLTDGDHVLADHRVDDFVCGGLQAREVAARERSLLAAPLSAVAHVENGVRLACVVELVEHELLGVTEVHEPQRARESADEGKGEGQAPPVEAFEDHERQPIPRIPYDGAGTALDPVVPEPRAQMAVPTRQPLPVP